MGILSWGILPYGGLSCHVEKGGFCLTNGVMSGGGIKSTLPPWFGAMSPTIMVIASAREETSNIRIGGLFCRPIIKHNRLQFLYVVKATALKHQISNFYPQMQPTDASYYIYISHARSVINIKASFCA